MAASAGTTLPQLFPLIAMKLKFNDLGGLFRRRHKLPFLHGILACLNEQRVSPDDPRTFHTSIRRNDNFNFDSAGNVHPFGKFRIHGRRLGLDLALRFVRRTRLGKRANARKNERRSSSHSSQLLPPASSHRHYSSWDCRMPRVREGTSNAMEEGRGNNRIGMSLVSVSSRGTVGYGTAGRQWRSGFGVPIVSGGRRPDRLRSQAETEREWG